MVGSMTNFILHVGMFILEAYKVVSSHLPGDDFNKLEEI